MKVQFTWSNELTKNNLFNFFLNFAVHYTESYFFSRSFYAMLVCGQPLVIKSSVIYIERQINFLNICE